jgi:hypothetical protein
MQGEGGGRRTWRERTGKGKWGRKRRMLEGRAAISALLRAGKPGWKARGPIENVS